MTVAPVSPYTIKKELKDFPDEVINGFNTVIKRNWNGSSARVDQDEVIDEILSNYKKNLKLKMTRKKLFDDHLLDVEDVFRKAGWKVQYDKPGYCESYSAYFIFSKPQQSENYDYWRDR